MAKASLLQRVKNKVKEWVSGGKKSTKATPPKPIQNRDARNETVSSRTYTSPRRAVLNTVKGNNKEERRVKSMAEATQSEAKDSVKELKESLNTAKKMLDEAREESGKVAVDMPIKVAKKNLAEYNKATDNRYNVKGTKDKAEQLKRRQAQKSQAFDVDAAKAEIKAHPTITSAARGATSGASFGLSDLVASQTKGDAREVENYYQAHKNKAAEGIGEAVGALASFGLSAPAAEKVGSKVVSKVAPKAAERLAESGVVKTMAKRGAEKAVEKGLIGEASEELIKQVGKEKAARIVSYLGEDIVQNLTTGAIYDINKASSKYAVGSKEWWDEIKRSAAWNAAITGGIAGFKTFGGNKKLVAEEASNLFRRNRLKNDVDMVNNYLWAERGVGAGNVPKERGRLFGESLDDRLGIVKNAPPETAAKETVEATANGAKPAANALRNAEEPAETVVDELTQEQKRNNILDYIGQGENTEREYTFNAKYKSGKTYKRKVVASSEEEALAKLKENQGIESADLIGSYEVKPKGAKSAANNLTPKNYTNNLAGNQPKKEYTIQRIYKSGAKRKVKVEATSEAEALKLASEGKNNVTNVKVLGSAEIDPKAKMMGEADIKANNIRAALAGDTAETTAKGVPQTPQEIAIANNPQNVEELGEVVGKKHEKVTNKEKTRDFWSSFRTKFVDSLDAFEQANKEFLKTDPERWAINNGAIDKLRRHQGMAVKSIDTNQLGWNGQPLKNADGSTAKSLKAIYEGLDEARENLFERYLLLRHSPARIAEGKPIFRGVYENADACIKEADEILAKNKDFAQRAEELYQYTRNELQNRVDAGLLPQEVADDWFNKYPYYVPTGRVGNFSPDEDIWELAHEFARNGNTIKPSSIKAATGSELDIRSIKEQLSEATTRNWRDMSMNNLFNKMFGDKIAAQLANEPNGGIETVLNNTVNLSKTKNGGKYFAEIFQDGKAHRVEIDKRFYNAIEDLNKNGRLGDAIDFATDVAAQFSTPFKNVVTSWNPIFMVKNGMRDFPEAIINSRNTKEFMECMDIARRDLYGVEGGGMWTQALRNQGVSQANFVNLDEALTKERDGVLGALGKGADKFATLQESVETYPRLVEFMATIKKLNGGTLPDSLDNIPMEWLDIAAANAADVTVNFGRSGSIGKMLNRGFVPFFNPSVQGFDKFIRNLSQQPSTKALLGTVAKAFALGTGLTAINNIMLDDNPYYQQIAAREKATNIIIACPIKLEDGKVSVVDKDEANVFIKIPKSRFAAAYSLPMVNVANDNKMGWAEMIKVAGDQVAPVNPVESNILAPFVLAGRNKTWYGTPIVSASMEDLPKSEQYDANTSWFGKTLGKATSKLPQELQISPKKADYIIDATTGVFGDFLLPMTTPSRQGGSSNPLAKAGYAAGNVVKRAFTLDATTQNDLSTRFYDSLQTANMNNKSEKGGKAEKEEYQRLSSYSTEISGINQAIRYLQDSDSKTKQKDIYELQKVRNQLMQDALDGKAVPTSEKMLDAVQKYVGTTYAVESFGSSADKEAMKVYGEAKYGNLSKDEMQKRIDSDTDFYNGVRAIGGLEDKMEKEGVKSTSLLSKAVALASANASDDMFGAYKCTKQSRTETADKMTRARNYFNDGGSEEEYVQLEKARKTMGKLSDYDKDAELDKIDKQLANGEISYDEYYNKQSEIKYNANISKIGLATSLAQANSPERAYKLYDIKNDNIRKGVNLAAMGFSARDYREMAKAVDTSGNGYLSRQEVVDYVAKSNVADKATLFDALYPYQTKYNPFGTPTNYTVAQAGLAGKNSGVASIGGSSNDFKISSSGKSSGNSYGGYSGYRSYKRSGGGSKKVKAPAAKSMAAATKKAKGTSVKLEPPAPKTYKVTTKFKDYEI